MKKVMRVKGYGSKSWSWETNIETYSVGRIGQLDSLF